MFSLRPPRRPVPASVPSSHPSIIRVDDNDRTQSSGPSESDNNPFESISSGWSFSSTLVDEWTLVNEQPSWASSSRAATPSRQRYRHSTPVQFSCEVPDDPLRAAAGLETVLEQPRPDGTRDENVAYSLLDFSRCHVPSIKPRKSVLSAMVTSQHLANPFTSVAPTTGGPLNIKVYFPRAQQPYGQLLELALPAIATVEDAIALALWSYWEKLWLPKLDVSRPRDTDVTSWIMLVPGKDGVVNKRIAQSKMANFKFEAYAIVRSPRNQSESKSHAVSRTLDGVSRFHIERIIENQANKFRLVSSPPATTDNKRHNRQYSMPILKSSSRGADAPVSLSKLP
ncbi:hypothetical protein K438DRAFT_878672 [Mycena galopus ATCC 62051]|nr:hypothetical protein K438DRAFT_878672 [Mycena galopus ATCC 62051]